MLDSIPLSVVLTGCASVLLCFVLLMRVLIVLHGEAHRSLYTRIVTLLFGWIILQSVLALSGVYNNTTALPPRLFAFGVGPMIVCILLVLLRSTSRNLLADSSLMALCLVHCVRIPVEFGLYQLAAVQAVPVELTFEGRNPDIIMGLSAPLVAYFFVRRNGIKRIPLLAWNIVGLLSLFNIVSMAIRATPYFESHMLFAVPNVAVLYFPWALLPTFIVPVVFFSHLLALVRLFQGQREPN